MQLRENSNLTKKKQYVTFCLSALVKWNTQAYLKLSFTSHNDVIKKEKQMAWNIMNPSHTQQKGTTESVRKNICKQAVMNNTS